MSGMGRREFVALLGGAAAWPLAARAQPGERMRRVGIVTSVLEADADAQARYAVLRQALQQLGWTEGRNIKFDQRFGSAGDSDVVRRHAQELVALAPDVIVASGSQNVAALQQVSRTVPIVCLGIVDPVGAGFVASLARPGGNITGLATLSTEISGKQLELLKEIVPRLSRVAVIGNSTNPGDAQALREMVLGAGSFEVYLRYLDVLDPKDLETAFRAAAKGRADALIVLGNPALNAHRKQIVDLAARHRLPATYSRPEYIESGGLMYYGTSYNDLLRRAASYVDKILKGAKPADLPVEQPKKFELIINLKAAKQTGLTIPPNVLARADRVIR